MFQHFESVHEQNVNSEAHENLETKTEDIEITIENIENGKNGYSCPICKKTYKGRQTLINNMRKKHKGKNIIPDMNHNCFIDINVEHEILNPKMINPEDNAYYQIFKGRTGKNTG